MGQGCRLRKEEVVYTSKDKSRIHPRLTSVWTGSPAEIMERNCDMKGEIINERKIQRKVQDEGLLYKACL